MLNQVVAVGRVAKLVEIKNKDKTVIGGFILKVPRSYQDEMGNYQDDFIKCQLSKYINFIDIKENELVGVKGRIESDDDLSMYVIVEKITYLGNNIIK